MNAPSHAAIRLLGTLGCHLCELAREQVLAEAERMGWQVQEVDIADDPALLETYGERIPVLIRPDWTRTLDWPFDRLQLRGFLERDD